MKIRQCEWCGEDLFGEVEKWPGDDMVTCDTVPKKTIIRCTTDLDKGRTMNPDTKEALIEMAEKAVESPAFQKLAGVPKTAESEGDALIARINEVTKFKVETIVQGFGCECGAVGAVQTKPEFVAQYCPICGKHFLAGTALEEQDRA